MSVQAVHWHEGMFLRPQHFQAADRHLRDQIAIGSKWNLHYGWGIRWIDLDTEALSNYRFLIRSAEIRMPDGTLVNLPRDGVLPAFELKHEFGREAALTMFLAVPVLQLTKSNVAAGGNGSTNGSRFSVDLQELEDENTGRNPLPVKLRSLNAKLLTSTDDHSGYVTLPIARVKRADMAEAVPELDTSYIPPLIACDAWKPLLQDVLHSIYDRLGKKVELLSGQVVSRNVTFDSQGQGDRLLFEQLRVISGAYAPLGTLLFAQGVHPLTAYIELCRLVGDLSIFGAQRCPPDLPKYDHNDLATCFFRVKQHVDALLDIVVEPEYKERPFIGSGLRMQVSLESAWLESGKQMFVGVQGSLPAEELEKLLTSGLDMKISSSECVDEIFLQGQAGLRFLYESHPPRSLPTRPNLAYFRIDRDSHGEEWDKVERSHSLAIRLNENLITSNIQGQRELAIKIGGQTTKLQFTLYVVTSA